MTIILLKYPFKQQKSNLRYVQIRKIYLLLTAWIISHILFKKWQHRVSLVAQWLRIRLPMQETRVQAPVREDPTCRGATKPMCHNYWVCTLEPASHNYWACVPQLLKPTHLEPAVLNKWSHCNEKPAHCNKE